MTIHTAPISPTATADALALAETLLVDAPEGAVTLINGRELTRLGGWQGVGNVLNTVAAAHDLELFECLPGDGLVKAGCTCHTLVQPKDELSRTLDSGWVTTVFDGDRSVDLGYDRETGEDFGFLPARTSPFGTPSLTALMGGVAREDGLDGTSPVLFVQVAAARPYAEMVCRQRGIAWPDVRASALAETYRWLAADLAVLAAARPNAATLIASDDRDPEWDALTVVASVVVPAVVLHAV